VRPISRNLKNVVLQNRIHPPRSECLIIYIMAIGVRNIKTNDYADFSTKDMGGLDMVYWAQKVLGHFLATSER